MSKNALKKSRQYTIRSIPESVDRALRQRVKRERKSFNQVVVEALTLGAGESIRPRRDFSGIVGSLSESEAKKIESEIQRQRQIDPELWKK